MTRYFILLIPFILLRLLTFPLAPIAVTFQRYYHLRFPFRWMDTIDNSLLGDEGWHDEHCKGNSDTYCCMVKWMWRNGGNWAAYYWFGKPYLADAFWSIGAMPFLGRELQWRLGWNTQEQKFGRCKINLAIRWRKK